MSNQIGIDYLRRIVDECGGDFDKAAEMLRKTIREVEADDLIVAREELRSCAETVLERYGSDREAALGDFARVIKENPPMLSALLVSAHTSTLTAILRHLVLQA